ncbi:MAG: ABC transporter permease [Inquilinaceae bacterium]
MNRALLALVALYIVLFCAWPLARLFMEALNPAGEGRLSLIVEVLSSRSAGRAAWHTLEAGVASSLVALTLGGGMALVIGLTDLRCKPALVFLLLMPILIPAQITAIAWLQLLGPSSPVLAPLGLAPEAGSRNPLYSREGIILLMGVEHAAMAFLAVRAGLRGLPDALIEAARAAGARPLRVVFTIVLPLLGPAMVAGMALAFVSAIGNFGIPALLGIPARYTMLTTLIYQRLNGFGPSVLGEVAALALVLAGMAAVGLGAQAWANRGPRVALDRSGSDGLIFRLGGWRRPVEAVVWIVLLCVTILPLAALATTSLIPALGVALTRETATIENYVYVLFGHQAAQRAFVNSALLAGAAALASVAISVPLAHAVLIRRSRWARVLDLVADAPFALPGIVLAIAFILVFLRPLPVLGIGLYGTFWILLAAYLGRFLALALRPTMAGMMVLARELEEAAQIAGAGPLRRMMTVTLPLVAPAAAAGGLLVFLTAFNELTVSALLWSAGHETLGVVVFSLYDEGNSTAAASVAMLSVGVVLAMALTATAFAHAAKFPRGTLPWQA